MSIKMKPIRNRDEISKIKETEKCIYFGFRPSNKDIITLIKNDPALEIIYIPESYSKTLSKSMLMLFEMKDIRLMTGSMQKSKHIESCYVLDESVLGVTEEEEPEEEVEDTKVETNEEFGNLATSGTGYSEVNV